MFSQDHLQSQEIERGGGGEKRRLVREERMEYGYGREDGVGVGERGWSRGRGEGME